MSRILPEEVVSRIKKTFLYDEKTGVIRWRNDTHGHRGHIYAGTVAGYLHKGYRMIGFMGKDWPAHHIAWIIMTGDLPPQGKEIDHRNRIRSDNHWLNFRLVTRSQNTFNSLPRVTNQSGMKGVSWNTNAQKWHVRITINGETISLGHFSEFKDACLARRHAELKYAGEYAAVYEIPSTP